MAQENPPQGFFFRISENGEEREIRLYSTTSDWNKNIHISNDGKSIQVVGNQQLRFCNADLSNYVFFSLQNKKVSWDLDLSCVKKNWNCAFYTCDFGGFRPPAYADAQSWQPRIEMDFQEASRTAYHYTAHRLWDKGGSMIMGIGGSVMGNPNQKFRRADRPDQPVEQLYGPDQYINTRFPFHVAITHLPYTVRIELSQDGRMIYNESTNGEYLRDCRLHEQVHTFIISLWSSGFMGWLDGNLPWYNEQGLDPVRATLSNICISDV